MRVLLNSELFKLFEKSGLDLEVALKWVLGYLPPDYTKEIYSDLFQITLTKTNEIELPEGIVQQVRKRIHPTMDMNKAVNFFSLVAFSLGGGE